MWHLLRMDLSERKTFRIGYCGGLRVRFVEFRCSVANSAWTNSTKEQKERDVLRTETLFPKIGKNRLKSEARGDMRCMGAEHGISGAVGYVLVLRILGRVPPNEFAMLVEGGSERDARRGESGKPEAARSVETRRRSKHHGRTYGYTSRPPPSRAVVIAGVAGDLSIPKSILRREAKPD